MVHEIYDEKMSVEMSLFLLTLQEKQVILVNLCFLLCLTAISTRVINGKWFSCQYWKKRASENLKQKIIHIWKINSAINRSMFSITIVFLVKNKFIFHFP